MLSTNHHISKTKWDSKNNKREVKLWSYMRNPTRLSADCLAESIQARRKWDDIFKVMEEKHCKPRIVDPIKLSFRNEGGRKTFSTKLRDFITTRRPLQELLKGILHAKNKSLLMVPWKTYKYTTHEWSEIQNILML